MIKRLIFLIAVPAVLLFSRPALASSGSWFAQGAGVIAGTTERWQWVATSDVGGLNVRGHFAERDSAVNTGFDADVTCLSVSGRTARIGIIVTSSTNVARPVGS